MRPVNPRGRVTSDYLYGLFEPDQRDRIVAKSLEELKPVADQFDTIAVRGVSGLSIGAILADRLSKMLLIVRKQQEDKSTHSSELVEGPLDWNPLARYLIVDDFEASGATVLEIKRAIGSRALYVGKWMWKHESLDMSTEQELAEKREKDKAFCDQAYVKLPYKGKSQRFKADADFLPSYYYTGQPITLEEFEKREKDEKTRGLIMPSWAQAKMLEMLDETSKPGLIDIDALIASSKLGVMAGLVGFEHPSKGKHNVLK